MFKLAKALFDRIANKIATDTGSIAHATNAVKYHVIDAPFAQSPALVIGDVSLESVEFTAIDGVAGAQNDSVQPGTGDGIVELIPPEGGVRWEAGDPIDPPISIHGIAVTDSTGAVLLATYKLENPVEMSMAGHSYTMPPAKLLIPKSAF